MSEIGLHVADPIPETAAIRPPAAAQAFAVGEDMAPWGQTQLTSAQMFLPAKREKESQR